MLRGGKELGKGLSGSQGGVGSDLMGGSQGSRETSLWDGMGEGAPSRNMGPQWDRGPLPDSFEKEVGGAERGRTGGRDPVLPSAGWPLSLSADS